jgi:hypothetical protein
MGWRGEHFETKRRRSFARNVVPIKHQAAQAHLIRLLSAHGVAVEEHPVATDRSGVLHGDTQLWRSGDLFGLSPTYEALTYGGYLPLVIFDICCASSDGAIMSALEIVAFAPPSAKKRAFLQRISFPVWRVDATNAYGGPICSRERPTLGTLSHGQHSPART